MSGFHLAVALTRWDQFWPNRTRPACTSAYVLAYCARGFRDYVRVYPHRSFSISRTLVTIIRHYTINLYQLDGKSSIFVFFIPPAVIASVRAFELHVLLSPLNPYIISSLITHQSFYWLALMRLTTFITLSTHRTHPLETQLCVSKTFPAIQLSTGLLSDTQSSLTLFAKNTLPTERIKRKTHVFVRDFFSRSTAQTFRPHVLTFTRKKIHISAHCFQTFYSLSLSMGQNVRYHSIVVITIRWNRYH